MKIPNFSTLLKYHILLGILLIFIPQLFIVHLYIFFGVYILLLFASLENFQKFKHYFLIGFLYFPLSEAVGRLHNLDPFVPWELGKYMAIFFLLMLIFSGKMVLGWRFALGILLILTTIINGNTTWKLIFFNGIGAYCIMLMGDFFRSIKLNSSKFLFYLRFALLPLLIFLFSSISQLQNFQAEEISLDSHSVLNGIPSNQVATFTGLGFFLLIVFYKWKLDLGIKSWQKFILAFGMLIIGIISFSRGGIVVGIIGVFLIYFSDLRDIIKFKYIKQMLFLIPILIGIAYFINNETNGNLFLRYQGETKGTLAGSKEKGINTLTTNRYIIMLGDLNTFENNMILGVETGRSLEYRKESEHQYSHVEFSRLLAEHGLIGLFVSIVWLIDLFRSKNALMRAIYVVGFLTTFHGATRTALPLVFMLISVIRTSDKC
jgi:hypothetical protein